MLSVITRVRGRAHSAETAVAPPEGASCLLPPPPPLMSARRLASRVRQVATALGRFRSGGARAAFKRT